MVLNRLYTLWCLIPHAVCKVNISSSVENLRVANPRLVQE